MNIDSYLGLLNARIESNFRQELLARKDIEQAMHGKATNLANQVDRAILWETASALVVLAIVCGVLVFTSQFWLQLVSGVLLLVCFAMLCVYYWKHRQLKHLIHFEQNTTVLLQNLIVAVKQFINLYHWMMIVSIVVGMIVGGAYGAMETVNEVAPTLPTQLTEWYAIPASTLLVIFTYLLTRLYLQWVYGKPLRNLEKCLEELSTE